MISAISPTRSAAGARRASRDAHIRRVEERVRLRGDQLHLRAGRRGAPQVRELVVVVAIRPERREGLLVADEPRGRAVTRALGDLGKREQITRTRATRSSGSDRAVRSRRHATRSSASRPTRPATPSISTPRQVLRAVRSCALDERLRVVDGDREADADAAGAATRSGRDRAVDADDLAGHVEQRAAGVALVDRRVGLDRVRVRRAGRLAAELACCPRQRR